MVEFRDRGSWLRLGGVVTIGAGLASIGFGLLHLALPRLEAMMPDGAGIDRRSIVVNALTYTAIGVALVLAGYGAVRLRRWSRSVMLIVGWTWLLGGLLVLGLTWALLDGMLDLAFALGPAPAPEFLALIRGVLLVGELCVGVLLPTALVLVYQGVDARRTLEARDPQPAWTDRCPLPVLGVSVGLFASAITALPLAIYAAVPVFGRLLLGWPAVVTILGFAALSIWLARKTYLLTLTGWWATTVLMGAIGLSTVSTLERGDPEALFRALGYPEDQIGFFSGDPLYWTSVTTAGLTVAGLFYMAAIRGYFVDAPAVDANRGGSMTGPGSGSAGSAG